MRALVQNGRGRKCANGRGALDDEVQCCDGGPASGCCGVSDSGCGFVGDDLKAVELFGDMSVSQSGCVHPWISGGDPQTNCTTNVSAKVPGSFSHAETTTKESPIGLGCVVSHSLAHRHRFFPYGAANLDVRGVVNPAVEADIRMSPPVAPLWFGNYSGDPGVAEDLYATMNAIVTEESAHDPSCTIGVPCNPCGGDNNGYRRGLDVSIQARASIGRGLWSVLINPGHQSNHGSGDVIFDYSGSAGVEVLRNGNGCFIGIAVTASWTFETRDDPNRPSVYPGCAGLTQTGSLGAYVLASNVGRCPGGGG